MQYCNYCARHKFKDKFKNVHKMLESYNINNCNTRGEMWQAPKETWKSYAKNEKYHHIWLGKGRRGGEEVRGGFLEEAAPELGLKGERSSTVLSVLIPPAGWGRTFSLPLNMLLYFAWPTISPSFLTGSLSILNTISHINLFMKSVIPTTSNRISVEGPVNTSITALKSSVYCIYQASIHINRPWNTWGQNLYLSRPSLDLSKCSAQWVLRGLMMRWLNE